MVVFGFGWLWEVVFGGGLFVWWCLTIASRLVSWRGLRNKKSSERRPFAVLTGATRAWFRPVK